MNRQDPQTTIHITVKMDKEHRLQFPKLVWQELPTRRLNLRMTKTHEDVTIVLTPAEAKTGLC